MERGLSQAVAKAQRAAASTIKVDVQLEAAATAAKKVEKSLKGTAGDSEALTRGFNKLNNTLGTIYQSIIVLSDALRGVGQSKDIKIQTDAMAKFLHIVGTVSKVAEAGTTISELTGRFARLAELKDKVAGFFKGASDGSAKTKTEATGLKGALQKAGDGFNHLFERIPDVGTTTITQITEDVKDAAGNIVSSTTKVVTANEILEQKNASVLRTIKGVASGWQESTAKAKETGATVNKVGETMAQYAVKAGFGASATHKLAAASSIGGKQHAETAQKAVTAGSVLDILAGKQKKTTEAINATAEAVRREALGLDKVTAKYGIFSKIKDLFNRKMERGKTVTHEFKEGLPPAINGLLSFGTVARRVQIASGEAGAGLKSLQDKFASLQQSGGPVSFAVGLLGKKLAALSLVGAAGVAVVGLAAVAKVATGLGKAIIAAAGPASQLAESTNAVAVTLGTEGAEAFKKLIPAASELGITQLALNQSITPIVPLLKNAGLEGTELASRLNLLVRRAVDLGSIFNRTTDDVIPALASALRGETEPAERLGISFNALAVDAKAAQLGFQKTGGEFEENAKQIARLELIMEKSTFAANDYNNTITGLANSSRNFRAVTEELSHEFSHVFLKASENITASLNRIATEAGPGVTHFFHTITPLMTDIGQILADIGMDGFAQSIIDAAGAVSTTFAPVMTSLLVALDGFLEVFNVLNVAFGRFIGGISPAAVALTGLFVFGKIKLLIAGLTIVLGHTASGLGKLAASSHLASGGMHRLGTAATFAGAGMIRVGAVLSKLAIPLAVITTGIALFQLFKTKTEDLSERIHILGNEASTAAEKLKAFFGSEKDFELLSEGVKELESNFAALVAAQQAQAKAGKNTSMSDQFDISTASRQMPAFNKALKEAKKSAEGFGKAGLEAAARAEIALVKDTVVRGQLTEALEKGVKAYNLTAEGAKAAADAQKVASDAALAAATEGVKAAQTVFDSILGNALSVVNKIKSADEAIISNRDKLTEATKDVATAEAEYLKIKNDSTREAKELLDAENAVIDARESLRDLEQERVGLLKQLAELEKPATKEEKQGAQIAVNRALERQKDLLEGLKELERDATEEEKEGAVISLARAQISLNSAIEAEQELLKKKVPIQKLDIDLTGLSLDQIKNKVAGIRAAAAAQDRAEKKEEDVVTEDEALSARLDVMEAENAVEESKKTQDELNNRALLNADEILEVKDQILESDEDVKKVKKDQEDLNNRALLNADDIREVKESLETLDRNAKTATLDLNALIVTQGELIKGNTTRKEEELVALDALNVAEAARKTIVTNIKTLEGERAGHIADAARSEEERNAFLISENASYLTQLGFMDDLIEKQRLLKAEQKTLIGLESTIMGPGAGSGTLLDNRIFTELNAKIAEGNLTAKQILAANNIQTLLLKKTSLQEDILTAGFIEKAIILGQIRLIGGTINKIARDAGLIIPGAREGMVLTSNSPNGTLVRAGERGNPEAIFPLHHADNAMSVLRSAFPYMSMGLQNQLAPALQAPSSTLSKLNSPPSSGYKAPFSAKPSNLELKLDRLIQLQEAANSSQGGLNTPITVNGSHDAELTARRVAREIKKIHRKMGRR